MSDKTDSGDGFDAALTSEEAPNESSDDSTQRTIADVSKIDSSPLRKFFFGDDPVSIREQEEVDVVWKHFAAQSKGPGDTLNKIMSVERTLALPPAGTSRVQHLSAYIRLLDYESDIQSEKNAYKK